MVVAVVNVVMMWLVVVAWLTYMAQVKARKVR